MFNSTLAPFLAAAMLSGLGTCDATPSNCTAPSEGSVGCAALESLLPSQVFYPGSAEYEYESQAFWSNTEILNPTCIFRPESAANVSTGLAAVRGDCTEFAIRGGGHMGIAGSNNIDDGVLMVLSNLTTLELSSDQSNVTIGPGYKWGQVYSWLEQYGLGVAGGRLSPVGVPGLLLAGGVNFYGNQAGWSADTVLSYEVVLANGTVVTASASSHADLFWALKGGSSNFGIVTGFTLRTFPSPRVWAGTYIVSGDDLDDFFAAIADFAAYNTDPMSHLVPMTVAVNETTTTAAAILFYDSADLGGNKSYPDCFAKFYAIPAVSNTCTYKTLSSLSVETGALVVDGINDMFIAGTVVGADYDSLLRGLQITNDVFFAALPALFAAVPFANFSLVSMDWQPIGALWQAASARSNPAGNALGVDPASKGTYLCWAEVVEWYSSDDDAAVEAWVQNTTAAIEAATVAAGLHDDFTYMGDAAGFQDIYPGYGAENEARLLNVSKAYDPDRVFQTLLPGGFKIGV